MALGSYVERTGRAGRRGALHAVPALRFPSSEQVANAAAVSLELMRPSLACDQITVGGAMQPVAVPLWSWTRRVRHSDPVLGVVIVCDGSEDAAADSHACSGTTRTPASLGMRMRGMRLQRSVRRSGG